MNTHIYYQKHILIAHRILTSQKRPSVKSINGTGLLLFINFILFYFYAICLKLLLQMLTVMSLVCLHRNRRSVYCTIPEL